MFDLRGVYRVEVIRGGRVIDRFEVENLVTVEGKNYLLKVGFGLQSPVGGFFIGLIGNAVTIQQTDTASACLGASGTYGEITAYNGTTRPSFSAEFSDFSNSISNANNSASFTFSGNVNVYGIFLCSSNEKGSNAGILFSASRFPTMKSFVASDILNVIYTVSSVI